MTLTRTLTLPLTLTPDQVSEATVQPASLHSRVLTSVSWDPRPPSPWGMQAGFGLIESSFTRKMNSANTMAKNVVDFVP